MGLLTGVAEWFLGILPTWTPDLPSSPAVGEFLGRVDSVVPILGPLRAVAGLLGLVVVFGLIRAFILLRHLLLP